MTTEWARFGWMDAARVASSEVERELRELAQLWVIGNGVEIDSRIRDDLSPFPEIAPDTARLTLRDKANAFLRANPPGVIQVSSLEATATGVQFDFAHDDQGHRADFFAVLLAWPSQGKYLHACANCGKAFMPERRSAVYCSDNCRVAAHMKRKREAEE